MSEVETRLAEDLARLRARAAQWIYVEPEPESANASAVIKWLLAERDAAVARVRTDTIAEAEKAIRGVYGVAQDPDHALDLALAAVRGVSHEH